MAEPADIIAAIRAGDIPRIQQLLKDDPQLAHARGEAGEPALLLAIYHRQRKAADLLVSAGADVDVFAAAAAGYLDRLRDEVERDSSTVNAFNHDGWTPLHLAAYFGQLAAAEFLLSRRADIAAVSRNTTANMPLHAALSARQTDLARLLLDRGANPNAASAGGWRPLHQAADNGDIAGIELLLASGAEVSAPGPDGRTPLSMAVAKDRHEAADLLRRHGAV